MQSLRQVAFVCVCVCVCVKKPHHQPPALLTAFRTLRAFCPITNMLLADAVLVSFAVTPWTRADPSLKAPSA